MNAWTRFIEFVWDLATYGVPVLLGAVILMIRKVLTNEAVLKAERAARREEMAALRKESSERLAREERDRREILERLTRLEDGQTATLQTMIQFLAKGK